MWNLGYGSSDWKEDRDEDEYFDDEDELLTEAEIIQKIHSGQELTESQMETVGESTRLQDVYNMRWWNLSLPQSYVC